MRTLAVAAAVLLGAVPFEPPAPGVATPSPRQLRWHALDTYAFLHFSPNTFTDKEWGYGDEDPALFNPTAFDADQIVGALERGGMTGVILTAKHHDGFCLWPTKTTRHSVAASPWKGGKGDVVREIADAARRRGLRFGVYLSPWDRNHPAYGTPAYVAVYRAQLRELLTDYGPIFEVWHDGANGGDGYYGGARETRRIDRRTYYDWPRTWALVRELQPDAVIFSDVGPDVRWVGNEKGIAGETNWAAFEPVGLEGDAPAPGYVKSQEGQRGAARWIPAECDVSIRPGWFFHEKENGRVRSVDDLFDLYLKSVGRGCNLLLNVPPDRRGLLHETDVAALAGFHDRVRRTFATDLARGSRVAASSAGRDEAGSHDGAMLVDGRRETVRVPVRVGHSEAVNLEFHRAVTPEEAREALRRAPGVVVVDDLAAGQVPQPLDCEGRDEVFVGRIRKDPSLANGLNLWVVADNLRKGAATNAVQIAEVLVQRGWLPRR